MDYIVLLLTHLYDEKINSIRDGDGVLQIGS